MKIRTICTGLLVGVFLIGGSSAFAESKAKYLVRKSRMFVLPPSRALTVKSDSFFELLDLTEPEAHNLRTRGLIVEKNQNYKLLGEISEGTASWGFELIRSREANKLSRGSGEGVTVCVIDSGADVTHPALVGRISGGHNFLSNADLNDIRDEMGHGTHVSGIIAGNDVGNFRGVAPSAKLIVQKVFTKQGTSETAAVVHAILDCIGKSQVINLSLGGAPSDAMADAILTAVQSGMTVIAASGNGSLKDVGFPASLPTVKAVGGIGRDLQLAPWTNRGDKIEFYAPGGEIFAPVPGGYRIYSGTSMASAFVAGVEAIRISRGTSQILGVSLKQVPRPVVDAAKTAGIEMVAIQCFGENMEEPPPSVMMSATSGLAVSDLEKVAAWLSKEYSAIKVRIDYDAMTFNGGAISDGTNREIYLNLGLILDPRSTSDVLALAGCHEIGHHLGGPPQLIPPGMSYEGQADFFAPQMCLHRWIYANPTVNVEVRDSVKTYCKALGSDDQANRMSCPRVMEASIRMAEIFGRKHTEKPRLEGKDPIEVVTTLIRHGSPQCRMDTFKSGYLNLVVESTERPKCWYANPSKDLLF